MFVQTLNRHEQRVIVVAPETQHPPHGLSAIEDLPIGPPPHQHGCASGGRGISEKNMADTLFEWACAEIRDAEQKLGHQLSWRFLTTPAKTLAPDTKIAFIALNPGGNRIPADHGRESCERGSAYLHENWRSVDLQQQVQSLFREIAVATSHPDYRSLMDTSLMAYYIPFRSPNHRELRNPKDSRSFAFRLWSRLMEQMSPHLIVTIDRDTFTDFARILAGKPQTALAETREFETGWGNYGVDVARYRRLGTGTATLVRFPHLSRFKIFDRPASDEHVRRIVSYITEQLR